MIGSLQELAAAVPDGAKLAIPGDVFHSTGVASSAARTSASVFGVLKTKLWCHRPYALLVTPFRSLAP